MNAIYRVTLDLPPVCCSPNYNLDTLVRRRIADGKRKAEYKAVCAGLVRNAAGQWGVSLPFRVPVSLHFDWYCGRDRANDYRAMMGDILYRPRDIGNAIAACKVAIDSFIVGGVIVDDDYLRVVGITARLFHGEQSKGRCEMVASVKVEGETQ